MVPKNRNYHLKPITFSGPCKSHVTFKVSLSLYITYTICASKHIVCELTHSQSYMHTSDTQTNETLIPISLVHAIFCVRDKLNMYIYISRSMERSKHHQFDRITKGTEGIGLRSRICRTSELKVVELASSMAMEGNGGRTLAKLTSPL